jgi:hypothetical protein
MGTEDLVDNLAVVVGHLRAADAPPDIYANVLGALWQANVVVEQQGAGWISPDLQNAYSKFSALEHPAELPSDGHRDQWRRARDHISQEAEAFANAARAAAQAGTLPTAAGLEPLARTTEVMAHNLNEGIPIS